MDYAQKLIWVDYDHEAIVNFSNVIMNSSSCKRRAIGFLDVKERIIADHLMRAPKLHVRYNWQAFLRIYFMHRL